LENSAPTMHQPKPPNSLIPLLSGDNQDSFTPEYPRHPLQPPPCSNHPRRLN
jgi:hypothetical protein